ncbi:MAG: DUF4350 domain-containing protein [Polyangiales bacterium]
MVAPRTSMGVTRRVLGFTVFISMIALSRVSSATPFDPGNADWEGCARLVEIAREELGPSRVQVVSEVDYEHLGPTDGLLLLHPEGSYDLDELSTFMKLGGRLAVIDDFGDGDRLLERFRIVRGPSPSDPLQMLHGNPQLPIATPSSGHPIVADVAQVVLNHPTTVRHPELSTLLRIPRVGGDAGPDVALAGQVGDGRLVAIGDPSIFINSMMRFPGNRAIAKNLVVYLLDGAGERRREARLTITFGKFREKGTLGGGLRGTFRDRFRGLLCALDGVRRGGFAGGAARIVALGIVVAAAIWVAIRAATRTRIPRPRYAASDPEAEHLGRALEDPRLAPLFFGDKAKPSAAGVQLLMEATDSAIAGRDDLRDLPRDRAVSTLATEAGLSAQESTAFAEAYLRLRSVTVGQEGSGARAWKATKREIALFGRVLRPVADSLRGAR